METTAADGAGVPPTLSLGDWLAARLRERLLGGAYRPGEWIREAALRREFGLSNGPVREALQMLVADRALVREARRGVRVVELADDEVVELFQVRLALLELAAELAARCAAPQDVDVARAIIATVQAAVRERNAEALMPAGGALVDWVCRTSGNRQLVDSWERLSLRSRVYINASLKACRDLASVGRLWQSLVDAIAAGNVEHARAAARGMVRQTLDDLGLSAGL